MRIESRLSYRFLNNLIALYIMFAFLAMCASVIEPEWKNGPYGFHWAGFGIAISAITVILSVSFVIALFLKKIITVDSEAGTVTVRPFFSGSGRCYILKDLIAMDWENKNRTYGTRYGGSVSLHQKSFSVGFSDGRSLRVKGTDYANFTELQSFFFNYCERHGIIHIAPLEERKKSILKRRGG